MDKHLFECSLGIHEYTIPDKKCPSILICKHCKKFGYRSSIEYKCWYEFDDKENMIHWKDNIGRESWLHNGNWVYKKPKDWKYENE